MLSVKGLSQNNIVAMLLRFLLSSSQEDLQHVLVAAIETAPFTR